MSIYLEGLRGDYQGKRVPIQQNVFSIGRGSACQLVLRDTYISRTHATLFSTQSGYAIRDENSRLGTKVNGRAIQNAPLRNGDMIEIGGNVFRFSQGQPAPYASQARPQADYRQPPIQAPISPHEQQYQAQYPPAPRPRDSFTSSKDRTTAALLAIFLGGVGAHKLYLGQRDQFILYLLFCWSGVPGIIAIFDGVTLLGMSDEEFHYKFG